MHHFLHNRGYLKTTANSSPIITNNNKKTAAVQIPLTLES